jgi:hypothetical protein
MINKLLPLSFLITFLVLGSFILCGCNRNKNIEEGKFVKIYTDLIIAKDTTSPKAQSPDDVINNVLVKHNITLEEYKATVQYYNQDSERWEKFFVKAIAYLEDRRKRSAK